MLHTSTKGNYVLIVIQWPCSNDCNHKFRLEEGVSISHWLVCSLLLAGFWSCIFSPPCIWMFALFNIPKDGRSDQLTSKSPDIVTRWFQLFKKLLTFVASSCQH